MVKKIFEGSRYRMRRIDAVDAQQEEATEEPIEAPKKPSTKTPAKSTSNTKEK